MNRIRAVFKEILLTDGLGLLHPVLTHLLDEIQLICFTPKIDNLNSDIICRFNTYSYIMYYYLDNNISTFMCCITVLVYKLLQKCHKKKEEAMPDKQHELFTLEEHIDQKIIELINDVYKWKTR